MEKIETQANTEDINKIRLIFGLLISYSLFIGIGFLFDFFLPHPSQVSWVELIKSHIPDSDIKELKIASWSLFEWQYSNLIFPGGIAGIFLIALSAVFFLLKKWVYPALLSILFYLLIQGVLIEFWLGFRRNTLLEESVMQTHFLMHSISISIGILAFLSLCFFIPLFKEKE